MLKIDLAAGTAKRLPTAPMSEAGMQERQDMQTMFCRNPQAFVDELGEDVWIVGDEIEPADVVDDRIDILGIDSGGNAVIFELKRARSKLHLLQAISYAAMIRDWEPEGFVGALQYYEERHLNNRRTLDEVRETLCGEIDCEFEDINRGQRIVLIAESFSFATLKSAEWLVEEYNVDIRCYRIELSTDGDAQYLSCARVYPAVDPEDAAAPVGRASQAAVRATQATTWEEALATVRNPAVASYFHRHAPQAARSLPGSRRFSVMIGGRRRYRVKANRAAGFVLQYGRFEGDVEFWRGRLSAPHSVRMRHAGRLLRFQLFTEADFTAFQDAVTGPLVTIKFAGGQTPDDQHEDADA